MLAALPDLLDVEYLIEHFGTIGLISIIFIESCIFPLLPGDSLLFAAGLFAARGNLNLATILAGSLVAAVLGNQISYLLGSRIGPALFDRPNSRLFKPIYLQKSHAFFEKYGTRAIVIARFVPIVRTFCAFAAGIGKMRYTTFLVANIIGAILWTSGIILTGYFLGERYPSLADRIEVVAVVIIVISLIPILIEYLKHRRSTNSKSN